jgi:hypothetical protein
MDIIADRSPRKLNKLGKSYEPREDKKPAPARKLPDFGDNDLVKGIILSEVLGKPKALKKR